MIQNCRTPKFSPSRFLFPDFPLSPVFRFSEVLLLSWLLLAAAEFRRNGDGAPESWFPPPARRLLAILTPISRR